MSANFKITSFVFLCSILLSACAPQQPMTDRQRAIFNAWAMSPSDSYIPSYQSQTAAYVSSPPSSLPENISFGSSELPQAYPNVVFPNCVTCR